jgi:tetratricopeptide (TPR) repeat protein
VALEGIERARAQGHRLALVELLRVRGMVLARRGRWDEAEHAFEEAVSVARSVRYLYAEARSLRVGSDACKHARPAKGSGRLEEAAEIFLGLGSHPYSDLAQKAMAGLNPEGRLSVQPLHETYLNL